MTTKPPITLIEGAPFTESFESSALSLAVNSAHSVAHGLGGTPTLFKAVAVCNTSELGYSVGDEVDVTITHGEDTLAANWTNTTFVNSTNIGYQVSNRGTLISKRSATVGSVVSLTPANWDLILRAWR